MKVERSPVGGATRWGRRGAAPASFASESGDAVAEGRNRLTALLTALVVGGACGFVLWQLRPDLLLADTTTTGSDTGAHVWGPAYLRDHLLTHGRLTGWTPDWYGGFPWLTFYFPGPSLFVVLFDVVLPYNIAFKLVTVLGVVTMPLAAWAFGRLMDMPRPGPACLAVATVPFLFDQSFNVYGGNIPSTLAGEFSYSIGLSIALVFLGVYARGIATGRLRALAAGLLALIAVCHVVTAFFAVAGAVVLTLMRPDRHRLRFAIPTGVVAALLAAFWTVPFLLRISYTTDLGWEKIVDFKATLFPKHAYWTMALAGVGVVLSAVRRRQVGLYLSALAVVSAAAFVLAPQSRLWNARLLPFWMLSLYLLAGVAVAEAGPLLGRVWAAWSELGVDARDRRPRDRRGAAYRRRVEHIAVLVTPVVTFAAVVVFVALPLQRLPSWFPLHTEDVSYIPEWVAWNYSGYERVESYPEYKHLIETMRTLGRTEGCGRAMWEYSENLDRLGTSYGLMLLPYWTDGCIGSMKGLFDESSASAPYYFLAESELSRAPTQVQSGLPYRDLDIAKGVEHLQLLGVRYFMALSDEAKTQARTNPSLRLLATSGPWTDTEAPDRRWVTWEVYRVEGSDIVAPLSYEPVVMSGAGKSARSWLAAAVPWYQDSGRWDAPLAASGPPEWRRVRDTDSDPPRRPVTPAVVSDIHADDDSISFEVDRIGSPVLVKASYFPNWQVSGARGVWRVAPNQLVVVPTSRHVTLRYGTTPVDLLAWGLTLLGLVGLVVLWRRDRVEYPALPTEGHTAAVREGTLDRELASVADSPVGGSRSVIPSTDNNRG